MLLSYIKENITLSSEAILKKISLCKWKRDCRKYCLVRKSWCGIEEKNTV